MIKECWAIYAVCRCGHVVDDRRYVVPEVCPRCGTSAALRIHLTLRWDKERQENVFLTTVGQVVWWKPWTWLRWDEAERVFPDEWPGWKSRPKQALQLPPKILAQETVEKMQAMYWVLQSCYRDEIAGPYDWVFSLIKPYPVPNQSMPWRRPTFEECNARQAAYDEDPAGFVRKATERSKELHGHVQRAEADATREAVRPA